jgi:SAM-dependent methyltransferase
MLNVGFWHQLEAGRIYKDLNGTQNTFMLNHDLRLGIPADDNTLDLVYHSHMLEHLTYQEGILFTKECMRVLKPGGILILRVPYKEDLEVYLSEGLDYDFIHLRNFDVPSLRLFFTKIFCCEYVTHETMGPHLQGAPRLKIRLIEEFSPIRATLNLVPWWNLLHPLSLLKWISLISEEFFVRWIYSLRDRWPDWFDKVGEDIVHGIEVNIIFKKK